MNTDISQLSAKFECIDTTQHARRMEGNITCTDIHHVMPDYITLPHVDSAIVAKQAHIFKTVWPDPTDVLNAVSPQFADLYTVVKSYNLPNFLGARATVPSELNLDAWESMLEHYHDNEICYFLRFGWPVGYHIETPPTSVHNNHLSADQHGEHMVHFISTEIGHEAIAGPFRAQPFTPWTRISPLMTRPKRDSDRRRVIVDLSFPTGEAVNDGIDIESIYGRDSSYTLPSVRDLTTYIQQDAPRAWLWKADLARAYRQLRVDPIDTPLLGFTVNGETFVYMCPSFGCRSSSSACHRVSAAVVYLMASKGFKVLAFLDDFAGWEPSYQKASEAYQAFLQLTSSLGLKLSSDKCQPPSRSIQWLGYDIDALRMSVAIPPDRLIQVQAECNLWLAKVRASRSMIQSLVGKLIHLANCVRHARKFTARILTTLRYMISKSKAWITLDEGFKADVKWFQAYAQSANGLSLISPVLQNIYIECDSSLHAGGGNSDGFFFVWTYTDQHKAKYQQIHQLEAINLLVAYRTLSPWHNTAGRRVVMVTDNAASSFALTTGRTKDSVLASCTREMWLEAAKADHELSIQHKDGNLIPLADALSRVSFDPSKTALAHKLIAERNLSELKPKLDNYVFFNDI